MTFRQIKLTSLLITGLVCTSGAYAGDSEAELKTCARITDRDARFICYDSLGKRVLQESLTVEKLTPAGNPASPPAVIAPVVATVPAEAKPATPVVQVKPATPVVQAKPATPVIQAKPTTPVVIQAESQPIQAPSKAELKACKQDAFGKWYFYFTNGDVWKQVETSRRRYGDCNFVATVVKDNFGHQMQIEGEKKLRVIQKR